MVNGSESDIKCDDEMLSFGFEEETISTLGSPKSVS